MKRNILIIIPQLSGGGAERVAANISKMLENRYNVFLATFFDSELKFSYGGNLINLDIPSMKGLNRYKMFLGRLRKLKYIKRTYSIDCSISFLNNPNLYNVLSKSKEKVIISIRSNQSQTAPSKLRRVMIKYALNIADKTISISDGVKYDLITKFGASNDKVLTIYNPINIEEIQKDLIEEDKNIRYLQEDVFNITCIGSLRECKGHLQLIKSFKKVYENHDNARLTIIGEGERRKKLQEFIDSYGLNNCVKLYGYVDKPHLVVNESSLFVLSSIYEGLANVIIEALACGKTVISSDCFSGPREILAPSTDTNYRCKDVEYAEYGILVPPFTIEGETVDQDENEVSVSLFADAISKIIEDENLRQHYEEKAINRASDFSLNKIRNHWIHQIEELLNT